MPSHVCHALAGRRALSGLPRADDATGRTDAWTPAFNLGCQGPDIFAHNRRTRPFALAYARLLHRHHYGSFAGAFVSRVLSGEARPPGRAELAAEWLRGFVTHQAIDRSLHPYIAYRSHIPRSARFPGVNSANFHAFFERILDSRLHLRLEGTPVSRFDSGASFSVSRDDAAFLSALLADSARDVYQSAREDPLIRERMENAFADASYFYAMTNPSSTTMSAAPAGEGLRRFVAMGDAGVALLYPETVDEGIDWLNESRAEWRDPVEGAARNESALDLFERGVVEASRCLAVLEGVLGGGVSPDMLASAVGDGPLSILDKDGKAAAVSFCDPFDLESALASELSARAEWVKGTPSVDRVKRELV